MCQPPRSPFVNLRQTRALQLEYQIQIAFCTAMYGLWRSAATRQSIWRVRHVSGMLGCNVCLLIRLRWGEGEACDRPWTRGFHCRGGACSRQKAAKQRTVREALRHPLLLSLPPLPSPLPVCVCLHWLGTLLRVVMDANGLACRTRLPEWVKTSVPKGKNFTRIKSNVRDLKLATVFAFWLRR